MFEGPAIFLFWHEYIPFLFYLRGHCHIAMLLSQHQDAEWLSQAAGHMGFGTIRGSTSRGGVSALRELMRTGETMNLTITPDGPRGTSPTIGGRLHLRLVALGNSAGADRPGVRFSVAQSRRLGPIRRATSLFAGARRRRTEGADSGGREPRRRGALSPARRTHAQHVHDAGRAVGRVGRSRWWGNSPLWRQGAAGRVQNRGDDCRPSAAERSAAHDTGVPAPDVTGHCLPAGA